MLLVLSGCRLLRDGDCDYEQRGVLARGEATDGTEVIFANVGAGGIRGSINSTSFRWDVSARGIETHITSIRLVNTSQRIPALVELPVTPTGLPFAFLGWLIQESGATTPALGGIFELVAANQTAIEIATDLPDRALITILLTVESHNDWTPSTDCY
jgi:hypothetical protein